VPAWQAGLRRSAAQLQQVFFPRRPAYRSEPDLFEASPLVLVREPLEIGGRACEISLVGRPAPRNDQAYSLSLTAAVDEPGGDPLLPVRVVLEWGTYHASVLLRAEGRVDFPDIPLAHILDDRRQNVRAGLDLRLEPA